jgi:hypothetical protein
MHVWGRLVVALFASLIFVSACGNGSDVDIDGLDGDVTPGFFIGETDEDGDLSIQVDSIRTIFFECGGSDVVETFVPPEPIATDGSFAVQFTASGGRFFTVSGRFTSQNHVEGDIEGDDDCDGHFEAHRCDEATQNCGDSDGDGIPDEVDGGAGPVRTPTRTPTPAATATVGATLTTTTSAATPTLTPSGTRTPTPMQTSTGLCGNGMVDFDDDEVCDPTAPNPVDGDELGCDSSVCVCGDFCDDFEDTRPVTCSQFCTLDFGSDCFGAGACEF